MAGLLWSKVPATWTGMLWFALLASAWLCYPRRPRTAGALFIMLGLLSVALAFAREAGNGLGTLTGLFSVGLGCWYLVKFRRPDVRAKHVEYWTARA